MRALSFTMGKFTEHIKDYNPTFNCYASGDNDEKIEFSITVENFINAGAKDKELESLKSNTQSNNPELIQFYNEHDGLKLYCQNNEPRLEFFPINSLSKANEEWKSWFDDLEEDEIYEFQKHGVAFGKVSNSGNYFVIYNGQIFYSDHDEWEEAILGQTLNEFLTKLASDPATMLYELGCYSRYSDGITDKQWIPKSYESNKK